MQTNEELVKKIKECENENKKRELLGRLYSSNYGLIAKICRPIAKASGLDMEDLTQQAYFGMIKAVDHFEESLGAFVGCLYQWTKQEVMRYSYENNTAFHIPEYLHNHIFNVRRFKEKYYLEHGKNPSRKIIIESLGIEPSILEKVELLLMPIKSLNESIDAEGVEDLTLCDLIASGTNIENDITENMYNTYISCRLWEIITDTLTERQSNIIKARYVDKKTFGEIAKENGINQGAARNEVYKILRELRTNKGFKAMGIGDYFVRVSIEDFQRNWYSATEIAALSGYTVKQ